MRASGGWLMHVVGVILMVNLRRGKAKHQWQPLRRAALFNLTAPPDSESSLGFGANDTARISSYIIIGLYPNILISEAYDQTNIVMMWAAGHDGC